MKSFKTMLLLSAALSGFMLSACGVDASEAQGTQMEEGAAQVSSEGNTSATQCVGSYQCAGPASSSPTVTVSCKWTKTSTSAQSVCAAACPSSTVYKSGSCSVVVVDPPPSTLR